jgi:hypothetical protein
MHKIQFIFLSFIALVCWSCKPESESGDLSSLLKEFVWVDTLNILNSDNELVLDHKEFRFYENNTFSMIGETGVGYKSFSNGGTWNIIEGVQDTINFDFNTPFDTSTSTIQVYYQWIVQDVTKKELTVDFVMIVPIFNQRTARERVLKSESW